MINPKLIKEYCLQEKLYIKYNDAVDPIKRLTGTGLLLSEGDVWERKRKILNKMFNFNYIKSLVPKAAEICDYSIRETEAESKKIGENVVQYHILNFTSRVSSNLVMESFLGGNIREAKIAGQPASKFLM